jgi:class 3 adenylate cyclase
VTQPRPRQIHNFFNAIRKNRTFRDGGTMQRLEQGFGFETRKLQAILAADIVGFSRLTRADEDRTLASQPRY